MALQGICLYVADSIELARIASNLGANVATSISTAVEVVVADNVVGDWPMPVQQFKLSALQGLKLSFTGISEAAQRDALSKQIELAGGRFSADLVKDCTHLVASQATGQKFKYAAQWGLAIVSVAWLEASCRLGLRQPEERFLIRGSGSGRPNSASAAPQAVPHSNGSNQHQHKPAGGAGADAHTNKSRLKDTTTAADKEPTTDVAAQPTSLGSGTDDGLFLDWVRFHPVGMTKEESIQVSKLVACGGAVREVNLNSRVTHIIIGSNVSVAEMAAVRQHALAWRDQVRVVKLAWLEHCVAHQHCQEPVDPSLQVQLSAAPNAQTTITNNHSMLRSVPAADVGPSNLARPAGPAGPVLVSSLLGANTASIDFGDLGGLDTRNRVAGPEGLVTGPIAPAATGAGGVAGVFVEQLLSKTRGEALRSLWFTLAAVSNDKELGALVRTNGGQVFTADSVRKVKDHRHAFALCPASLGPAACQELEKTAADFRCVPANQRVTGWWLQECLLKGKLLDPSKPDVPAFRPLPFDTPLPFPQHTWFHVAGYRPAIALLKKSVLHVLSAMGAGVAENLCPVCTHLVVPETGGAKWDLACRAGMIVVNEQWVLQLARTGRMPDPWEARFRPNKETPQQFSLLRSKHQLRQTIPTGLEPKELAIRMQMVGLLPATTDNPELGQTQMPTQGGAPADIASKSMSYSVAGGFKCTSLGASNPSVASMGGQAAASAAAKAAGAGGDTQRGDAARPVLQTVPQNVLLDGTHSRHASQEGPSASGLMQPTAGKGQVAAHKPRKEQELRGEEQGKGSGCGGGSGHVHQRQPLQQEQDGQEIITGSAGEEDALMGIEALMATHQGGIKQLGAGSQMQDSLKGVGQGSGAAACLTGLGHSEVSRDSGGQSSMMNCSGQPGAPGADTSSKPTGLPRRASKRQQALLQQDAQRRKPRTRRGEELLLVESSQQVGYEADQRPDERLLRKKTARASHSTEQEDAKQAAAKQQLMRAMSAKRQ